jgi:hypothetical protein
VPASKPKHTQRVALPVTCSVTQKKAIALHLSHIPPRQKSKYILELIKGAIADKYTEYCDDETFTHGDTTEWQISCSPKDREIINDYCDRYLPPNKRSRWIVNVILDKSNQQINPF